MKDIIPILTFQSRFSETPESFIRREWGPDQSCSKFWESFLKENEVADSFEFFADEVVVKHWFYCGSSCPFTNIYSYKEDFMKEIQSGYAGDIFEIWTLSDSPKYYMFKCPDYDGNTPKKGSY
jgi:hypothetical protein